MSGGNGILDTLKSVVSDVAYPNRESETGRDNFDAATGTTATHDGPESLWGAFSVLTFLSRSHGRPEAFPGERTRLTLFLSSPPFYFTAFIFTDALRGDAGVQTMRAHGNIGEGHGSGLQRKAVAHQEELAERTRLKREGLFEPHVKHDKLVNMSDEHRSVADGAKTFGTDGSGEVDGTASASADDKLASADDERLV